MVALRKITRKFCKSDRSGCLKATAFFYIHPTMIRLRFDFHFHVHVYHDRPSSASSSSPLLADYFRHQIEQVRGEGRFSTASNYGTALRSFLRFMQGENLQLKDLTLSLVARYERWLKSRHIAMNTISCYLRSLRAVYNKAVEEKLVTDLQPFKDSYTGYPRTDKRSIGVSEIRKLQDVSLREGSSLRLVRDIFLFCIFACGIPFVDVAFLRKSQIDADGYLTYQRRKTNQQIRLKLQPCAMEIVRRYESPDTDYVFPILTSARPEEAYRQYRERLTRYNRQLKRLSRLARISGKLTSYVSRHSWASLAYDYQSDVSVISKGLGHTSSRTTYVYIKGIDDTRLDDANLRIIKEITGKKVGTPYKR